MLKTTRRPLAGFTLIELLTVSAISGILASIIIPSVGAVRISAQKAAERANLGTIGKSATIYATDNSDYLPDPLSKSGQSLNASGGLFKWMLLLARAGTLTGPSFYFSKIDQPQYQCRVEDLPGTIYNPTNHLALATGIGTFTPNVELVGGLKTDYLPTTPIAFIRGLRTDGQWDKDQGVYGESGGAIVFLGGNVQQYTSIDSKLTRPSGKPTNNILETIPYPPGGNQRVYGKNAKIGTEGGTKPQLAN